MRVAALVLLLPLIAAVPAAAQVTINLRALDAVPAAPVQVHRTARPRHKPAPTAVEASKPATPSPAAQTAVQLPARAPAAAQETAKLPGTRAAAAATPPAGAPVAKAARPLPTLPAAPPAPPPPQMMATIPAAPPAAATGGEPTSTTPRRLDLQFAAGKSSLSPEQARSVTLLAASARDSPGETFEVAAHAPAVGDDASSARRLSLDRALAVRAALIAGGVPPANVYMRALGAPPPSESARADRASITVMGANTGVVASSPPPEQAKKP